MKSLILGVLFQFQGSRKIVVNRVHFKITAVFEKFISTFGIMDLMIFISNFKMNCFVRDKGTS